MDKKKNCIAVTPDVINDIAISDDNNGQKNISQDISLLSDISLFRNKIPIRQPFCTTNPQVLIVTQGTAEYNINFVNCKLYKGDLLLIPINTLLYVCCRSEDYKGKLIDIRMPANNKLMLLLLQFRKTILDDHDFKRINCYFNLIGECLNGPYEKSGVTYLVMALLYDVGNIMSTSQQHSSPQKKEEELYTKFMQLLQCEYDTLPRTLIYYAEKLKVTSNHLGVVVKKVSGNTPLQWINKVSIEQSKYLIINNELSMNQIAYKVGFSSQTSFCRFFKKEVGLSPLEYLQSYRVRQAVK